MKQGWLINAGSVVSYILLAIAAGRCISACFKMRSGRQIVISGLIGLAAYLVPALTVFWTFKTLYWPGLYLLIPICVMGLGFWCNKEQYETLLSWKAA